MSLAECIAEFLQDDNYDYSYIAELLAGWLDYNKHSYPADHEYSYNTTFQFFSYIGTRNKCVHILEWCQKLIVTQSDKTSLIARKHTCSLNLVYLLLHMS